MENATFWDGVIFVLALQGFGYYAWWLYQRREKRKAERAAHLPPAPTRPQATPKDYSDRSEP